MCTQAAKASVFSGPGCMNPQEEPFREGRDPTTSTVLATQDEAGAPGSLFFLRDFSWGVMDHGHFGSVFQSYSV